MDALSQARPLGGLHRAAPVPFRGSYFTPGVHPPGATPQRLIAYWYRQWRFPRIPSPRFVAHSIEKLLEEAVAFFVIRHNGVTAGCGGIKLFGTDYGEIKRMYVRPALRGLGLGRRMLDHLVTYALHHGVHVLRLETGTYQPEARRLYERYGFQRIPPFGDYEEGPFHLFYEKQIP